MSKKRKTPPPDDRAAEILREIGAATPKRRKYGNVPVTVGGVTFDSRKECARYGELLMMERAGLIEGLERQVEYRLEVNGVLVARYLADHRYREGGAVVVEDVKGGKGRKGTRTQAYRIKRRLMLAIHGIEIREV